ncbi:MAG: DUF5680 domain-containing protein [Candidatus Spechtbacterales bacterium]
MTMPTIEEIQNYFFLAMAKGWAAGRGGGGILGFPGYEAYVHGDDRFRLIDRWCVGEDGRSAGDTTIWYDGTPVWVMHYGGWYDKKALPFLKKVLLLAYEERSFTGCRGPGRLDLGDYSYQNAWEGSGFTSFKGEEKIERPGLAQCGRHTYRGMALISFS